MSVITARRIDYGLQTLSDNEILCIICKEITPKSISYTYCLICFSTAHHSCLLKSESSLDFSLSYVCPQCKYRHVIERSLRYMEGFEKEERRRRPQKVVTVDPGAPSSPSNDIVKQLLGLGSNPSVLDYSLELPIHKAIRANNLEIVKTLLSHSQGFQNYGLYKQRTILHHAAQYGSLEIVKLLVKSGCSVNVTDCIQETPIFMAAIRGDVSIMKYLFKKGASLNAVTFDKRTLLHRTVWHDRIEATKWLLENGLRPDCQTSHKWTPLHSAAMNGNVEMANLLLRYGANLNSRCVANKTPLHVAKHFQQENMVRFLQESSALSKK